MEGPHHPACGGSGLGTGTGKCCDAKDLLKTYRALPASQDLELQQHEQCRVISVGSSPKPAVQQPPCQMTTEGVCNTSFPLLDKESCSSGTENRDGHRAGGRHDSLLAEQESSESQRAVEPSWKCWVNPCSQMLKLCNRNNLVQFVL